MPDLEPRHRWAAWTVAAAAVATGFDAALLQQKKAFFTGGFLAAVYTRTWLEAVGFLIALLALNACLLGVLVIVARRLTGSLRLNRPARLLAVMGAASIPPIVVTFISYRLLAYLGSGFDLSLMFDLTGGKPQEIFAVAAGQLLWPTLSIALLAAIAVACIRVVNRVGSSARGQDRVSGRAWLTAICLLVIGTVLISAATFASEQAEDGLPRTASGRVFATIARYVSDVDRDGYGAIGRLRDAAAFDAGIHPYAVERPGDGIDQNGVGGDLPADVTPYKEASQSQSLWQSRPDVVLIVLESFRADTLGRSVDGVNVTPTLDALTREGVSAPLAYSHNGYTAQSRFHLFSGSIAGVRDGKTLVDDFKANGYEVAYFSGQDESFGGAEYAVGFDRADTAYDARQDRKHRYTTFSTAGSLAVPARRVVEKVREFLERRSSGKPLFLYVNYHDTHYPYHHAGIEPIVPAPQLSESEIAPANQTALHKMYLNTAANVDRAIGETLAAVEKRLGHRPAVIVTADHGESLFDEGFLGHGYALNDVQTRIPFIVRGLPMVIEQPFGQAELRDAIGTALSQDAPGAPPRVVTRTDKHVFQYLGTIERPRQLGFRGIESRAIYDFRDDRSQSANGHSVDAGSALIHLWERMILARQAE